MVGYAKGDGSMKKHLFKHFHLFQQLSQAQSVPAVDVYYARMLKVYMCEVI